MFIKSNKILLFIKVHESIYIYMFLYIYTYIYTYIYNIYIYYIYIYIYHYLLNLLFTIIKFRKLYQKW